MNMLKNIAFQLLEDIATEITEIINNDANIKADFSSQSIAFVNFPSTLSTKHSL